MSPLEMHRNESSGVIRLRRVLPYFCSHVITRRHQFHESRREQHCSAYHPPEERAARKHDSTLMTLSAPHDLALAGNGIGDGGTRALAEALRHNSTLKELMLTCEPHPAPPYPIMRQYYCFLGSLGPCMRPGNCFTKSGLDCLTGPGLPLTAA